MSHPANTNNAARIEVVEQRFELDASGIAPDLNEAMRRRIGSRLRELYAPVTEEALPTEHVDLLLALRHKERDRRRATESAAA